ncbi:MAG: hypothetical protein GX288_06520 [Clostridiales bacterium]|nr:hypothetical protein [Clostridiales bacterium]
MSKSDCCSTDNKGTNVTVQIDVTKIVKYVCVSAVLIVGIIFGTRCYKNLIIDNKDA